MAMIQRRSKWETGGDKKMEERGAGGLRIEERGVCTWLESPKHSVNINPPPPKKKGGKKNIADKTGGETIRSKTDEEQQINSWNEAGGGRESGGGPVRERLFLQR